MSIKLDALNKVRDAIQTSIASDNIAILPPLEISEALKLIHVLNLEFTVSMIDPWYNKGVGGVRNDYVDFICNVLRLNSTIAKHVYFWGFPEIVAKFIDNIPKPLEYTCWLTWYYKNNPSVIRGWRSAQQTCLHLSTPDAIKYPEHFLTEKQLKLKKEGKLRYMPGPPSVIEAALNIGFIGKKEQTGHPSQKPMAVYEPLLKMTTVPGDSVLDLMAGSGTTGALCPSLGITAILCDESEEYIKLMEKRLNIKRIRVKKYIKILLKSF